MNRKNTATKKSHPVVEKYGLKTYYNKFDGQRCAISGQDVSKGVRVANVVPLMTVLNALSIISTKVFKYAKVALLPLLATEEETRFIQKAADYLLEGTDPEWRKDGIGCSVSSYFPCLNWKNADYHELGTQHVAKALRQHVGTQINKDSNWAKAILIVADRRWNETRPKEERVSDAVCEEGFEKGFVIREYKQRGELLIGISSKTQAIVAINPWENPGHGAVKDGLKSLGTKWEGTKKVWTLPLTVLAQALKDLDSLAITKETPVVVTPLALDALRAAWKKMEEQEGSTEKKSPDKVVEINGQKATIRSKSTTMVIQRLPGEVLVDTNGDSSSESASLKVLFDYPNTEKLVWLKNEVKNLGGRWNPEAKCWKLRTNAVAENLERLFSEHKLVVTPEAIEAIQTVFERRSLSSAMDLNNDKKLKQKIEAVVPEGRELFPFQTAGVAFIEASHGRCLIADEMGTGKSAQSATFLAYHRELRPAVIVVPSIVVINWINELKMWTTDESIYRVKNGKDKIPKGTSIVVITYDLAKRQMENLKALRPKAIIGDECHLIKNYKTQRAVAFRELAQHDDVKSVVLLSGTPIVNRPLEFYTALNLLRPDEFNSWFKYTERYCNGHRTRFGYQANGATNTEELASKLKDVMIRRLKKDVLKELPEKLQGRMVVEIASKARSAYKKAVKEADIALTKITAGRYALGLAKVAPALELIKEYKDQDLPLLIFAHHKDVMDGLCEGLNKAEISYGRIDGTVSVKRRGELVQNFQDGKLDVMVLSVQAAGVGITLTRAANVLFVERSWTPSAEEQASDRCHRIGQENAVTVRFLVVPDTLDEDMDDLIESKRAVLRAVLDQGKMLEEGNDLDIRKELMTRMETR